MPVVTVEKVYSKFNPLSIGVEPLLIHILDFVIGEPFEDVNGRYLNVIGFLFVFDKTIIGGVWGFEGFELYKYCLFVYTVEFPLFVEHYIFKIIFINFISHINDVSIPELISVYCEFESALYSK